MLTLDGLTKRFGETLAVDAVSLSIDRPQMLGVIGRSGAGKSTLLRMINRLNEATAGRILVTGADGQPEDVLTRQGRAKRAWQSQCAMIFQQFNLVPRLDVLTNVLLGRLFHKSWLAGTLGLFTDAERAKALSILDRLDIADLALQRAETLSGGQQQRVAIARALMQQPKILLADEPIASLDPRNARIVMDTLARIHREDGLLVITNLHTLDTARSYCDRVLGMYQGRAVFDGPPAHLTDAMVRHIYGVEADDATFDDGVTSTSLGKAAKGSAPPAQAIGSPA